MSADVKYRLILDSDEVFNLTANATAKGPSWTYPPDDGGFIPSNVGHGFIDFQPSDQFFSEISVNSDQIMIATGSGTSSVAYAWANANRSTSSYSYFAHALIQNRAISDRFGSSLTSGFIQYLSYFRSASAGSPVSDILADTSCGLGDVGVIAIKKIKYGENISPLSVTVATSAGTTFHDSASGDETFGIMVDQTGSSAGIIFYDIGVVLIHGPSASAAQTVSAVTAVTLQSTYKLWQQNAFCTVGADDFRYSTNPSAYYNRAVTGDPAFNPSLSAFNTYGYEWGDGDTSLSSTKGTFFLDQLGTSWGPYITTIGLYNSTNDLVAIAKLAQPIKKPQTYPITIRVALDFD